MPTAAVIERPTAMQMNTAKMIRIQRKASHKMRSTMAMVAVALSTAFSLIVANSSSAIGTGPVSRS